MIDINKEKDRVDFAKLMRDALDEELGEVKECEIDFSFMSNQNHTMPSKKKTGYKRILKIAAAIVCFFAMSTMMAAWMISQEAYAFSFNLERKLYMIKENFASDNDKAHAIFSDENNFSLIIEDWSQIDKAKRLMPHLPVPAYLPSDYKFESLCVTKWFDGSYDANYSFVSDNGSLNISVYETSDFESALLSIEGMEEVKYYGDRTMGVWNDVVYERSGCLIITNELNINLTGNEGIEEMIRIGENIEI